jgi:hypothetical protein
VTVLPPRFLQDLKNQTFTIGDPVLFYQLPSSFDPYNFPLTMTAVQQGTSSLPSFVRFNQTLQIFRIAPKSNMQIGDYVILVMLSDGRTFATYNFTISVVPDATYVNPVVTVITSTLENSGPPVFT